MRRILLSVFIGLVGLGFTAADVEARRLGGGMSQGMKRQMPAQRTPDNPPPQQQPNSPAATPATAGAAAAAPAAAARRSWMGPIAGLAGILGLAALASYFGLSEMFANIAAMLLLGIVVLLVVRWAMRRFSTSSSARPSGLGYAAAGGAPGAQGVRRSVPEALAVSSGANVLPADARPAAAAHGPHLPPGFDRAEFERAAKMIFVRMQAANDAGDLDDLRQFSTPEMFAAFRLDLQDRQGTQRTDVVRLDAELLDVATEGDRQIVSVRFHGLIREETDGAAAPFDEVWHLVRPMDGSKPWAIAGIQQSATTTH